MGLDWGTGMSPDGRVLTLRECPVCGEIFAGQFGHSPTAGGANTEAHKNALAVKERSSR